MERVGVILAKNSRNCGMYSVDLSAHIYLRSLLGEVSLLVPGRKSGVSCKRGEFVVETVSSQEDLDKFQSIIFWGDFTTTPEYGRQDFPKTQKKTEFLSFGRLLRSLLNTKSIAESQKWEEKMLEMWEEIYTAKDESKTYYSIGQNFQMLDSENSSDLPLLQSFENFRFLCPRDSNSLSRLEDLGSKLGLELELTAGLDVAFLLPPQHRKQLESLSRRRIVIFIGRSRFENFRETENLLRRFHDVTIVKDWIFGHDKVDKVFWKNINIIRSADVVVSDTYHFLINALREGCPVVGLSRKSDTQISTIGDFKKRVLFDDLEISEFLIEVEGQCLSADDQDRLLDLIDLLGGSSGRSIVHHVSERIHSFRQNLEKLLT